MIANQTLDDELHGLRYDDRAIARRYLRDVDVDVGENPFHYVEEPALAYVRSGGLEYVGQSCEFGPGEVAGAEAVFGDRIRPATVVASARSRVTLVEAEGYWRVRRVLPAVALTLEMATLRTLARCLDRLDERMVESASVLLRERDASSKRNFPFLGEVYRGGMVVAPQRPGRLRLPSVFGQSSVDLEPVQAELQPVGFRRGEVLVVEDQPPDRVLFIAEGEVEALRRMGEDMVARLGTIGPEGVVGMTSALWDRPHAATCVAVGPVQAMALDAHVWRAFVEVPDRPGSLVRTAAIRALAVLLPAAREQAMCAATCMRLAIHERLYPC